MTHWERCVAHAKKHADDLRKAKVRNIEMLMRSYLDQPAFYRDWVEAILDEVLLESER